MSQMPGLKMSDPMITVDPIIESVAATLGAVSPLMAGAIRVRIFDMLTHHRRSVGKAAGTDFPGKRHSQKAIFAKYFRYAQNTVDTRKPLEAMGKGWMPTMIDQRFWDFEFGRRITAAENMVMPIGQGLFYFSKFHKLLEEKKLTLIKRPGKPSLLVQEIDRTSRARTDKHQEKAGQVRGARMVIWGIIGRVRHQTKLLKFGESWERIQPKHLKKFDKTLNDMLTEAGRKRVAKEVSRLGGLQHMDTFRRHQAKLSQEMTAAEAAKLRADGAAIAKRDSEPKGDA